MAVSYKNVRLSVLEFISIWSNDIMLVSIIILVLFIFPSINNSFALNYGLVAGLKGLIYLYPIFDILLNELYEKSLEF